MGIQYQDVNFTLTPENPVANYRFCSYAMEIKLEGRDQIHAFVYLSIETMQPSRCVQNAYLKRNEAFRDGPFNLVWTKRDGNNHNLVITAMDSSPFEAETVRVQAATGKVIATTEPDDPSEPATLRSVPVGRNK